jgi:hypothetical protein
MRRVHPLRAAVWFIGGIVVLLAWAVGWVALVHPMGRRVVVGLLVLLLAAALVSDVGHRTRSPRGGVVVGRPPLSLAVPHAPTHTIGHCGAGIGPRSRPSRVDLPPPAGPCGDPWRRALRANPRGAILAPPSAAVAALQQALAGVGSPLADTRPRRGGDTYAEYLWDAGRRTGVDPAVVLAFFWVESHDGTQGVAVQTHSLSNARPVGHEPVVCTSDGCYAAEPDWFAGIDRMVALLLAAYAHGGVSTADQAIPVWAPASDYNSVEAFSASVHQTLAELWAASQPGAPTPP